MKYVFSAICYLFLASPALFAQGLEIRPLTGDFYIYTTYRAYNGNLVPSNGMYVLTSEGAILLDTPWDTTQVVPLLDSIRAKHNQRVIFSVSTHSHADRTAGLEILARQGVRTYSSLQTFELCAIQHEKQATHYFKSDTTFTLGQHTFSTFYPGKGHAPDNIVIWFDQQKILYGGCFVKSTEAVDLGYTGDADLNAWQQSVQKTISKFKKPHFVIPGHQGWANRRSLQHTLQLIRKGLKEKSAR